MAAYDAYLAGQLTDIEPPAESLAGSLASLPKVDG